MQRLGIGFGTVATHTFRAHVAVLAASLRSVHPDARLHVLWIDGDGPDPRSRDDVIDLTPAAVGLADDAFHRLALVYDAFELSCALKPHLLRGLLDRGFDVACYLDSDLWVLAPLGEVGARARESGLALTPHVLDPLPDDNLRPGERDLLVAGAYNAGVIATTRRDFIEWLAARTALDCLLDLAEGLHVDQRWIELAAPRYEATTLRDPGLNVGHWNVHERDLSIAAGGTYLARGLPLRCFHFSGFSPHEPRVLSRHTAPAPRARPDADPVLARLCEEYATALLAAGYDEATAAPYAYDVAADGRPITRTDRRVARAAMIAARATGTRSPVPDPFTPLGAKAFREWQASLFPGQQADEPDPHAPPLPLFTTLT